MFRFFSPLLSPFLQTRGSNVTQPALANEEKESTGVVLDEKIHSTLSIPATHFQIQELDKPLLSGLTGNAKLFTRPFTRQTHTQTQIDTWLNTHRASYISHAIPNVNLEKVISTGTIESAEAIFRKTFSVNIEESNALGWGWDNKTNHRTRIEITIPTAIVQELKTYATKTPRYFRIQTFIGFSDATKFNYTSWKDMLPVLPPNAVVPLIFRNKKLSQLEDHSQSEGIHGINWPCRDKTYEYSRYISNFCEHHPKPITPGRTAILLDSFSNNPIDLQLTKVWKSFKEIAPTKSPKELINEMQQWRAEKLYTWVSKIYPTICAQHHGIRWEYGDVVVLRGNPEDVISEYSRHEIRDNESNEVQLLWPFENNGKFFGLELAQQDTLILGPEAILSQYKETFSKQNIRSFYLEDLSTEQMDFFNVPKRLRHDNQQHRPRLDISIEKLNTIALSL